MKVITFGTESEHLEIRIPSAFSADGWGKVEVEIAVNGFHGKITPWVEAVDFKDFAKQLRVLYKSLSGEAVFSPLEGQLNFKLAAGTGGRIQLTGEAWSQATCENQLTFELALDQSYLVSPLKELEELDVSGGTSGA